MSMFARRWVSVLMVLGLATGLSAQETPRSGESPTSAATAEFPYQGEVTCERLNVRLAPKLDAATGVVAVLLQGEKVVALGMSGDFLIVEAPKKATAWIFGKHVKKDGDTGLVLVNDAALRTDSRANAEKIGSMKEGDQVAIVKEHLGWYQVSAPAGVKYYVAKKHVRFLANVDGPKPIERIESPDIKSGGSDAAAQAKLIDAKHLLEIELQKVSEKRITEVDLTATLSTLKEATELAKSEPVKKEAETEYRRIATWAILLTGTKSNLEAAERELAKRRAEIEEKNRDEKSKYEACGYVDTVGPLFYRPGTFKLMMSGKIIAFIRIKDGDEDMRIRMNRHYGKYVGVTGAVLKDPPGWPGHQVITLESVEELKK